MMFIASSGVSTETVERSFSHPLFTILNARSASPAARYFRASSAACFWESAAPSVKHTLFDWPGFIFNRMWRLATGSSQLPLRFPSVSRPSAAGADGEPYIPRNVSLSVSYETGFMLEEWNAIYGQSVFQWPRSVGTSHNRFSAKIARACGRYSVSINDLWNSLCQSGDWPRHHSMYVMTSMVRLLPERFLTVSFQSSSGSPSGTKTRSSVPISWFVDSMTVYPMPCRQRYFLGRAQTGFHPADQRWFFSSRR